MRPQLLVGLLPAVPALAESHKPADCMILLVPNTANMHSGPLRLRPTATR